MKERSKKDLETMLGDPKKAILAMALPMAVSYVVSEVNLFVDTFWTSGLGSAASSAISTVAPFYAMVAAFGVGLGVAASANVSFSIGRKDLDKASALAGNILMLGILVSVLVSSLILVLYNPIMEFMDADDVRELGFDYVLPCALMSWAQILNNIVAGLLRAEGGGRKSMAVLISAAAFNLILDPILIYGLGLGLVGAAFATMVSALVATIVGLNWYRVGAMNISLTRGSFRMTKENVKDIFSVSLPRTAESLINNVIIIVQRVFIIACAGTIGVMYMNMPWRFIGLSMVPAQAIGAALIPVCSAALGQSRPDKMLLGMRYSAKLVIAVISVMTVVVFVFADVLVGAYTYSETMAEHRDMLAWVLRVESLVLLPFALTSLGSSMLQSMKRSRVAARVMLIWAFIKLGMMYVASLYSFEAVIYALVLSHYVVFGIMLLFLRNEIRKKVGPQGNVSIEPSS